jgi:UDP-N-acetylmuramoylalanine--D-glutamate ligase
VGAQLRWQGEPLMLTREIRIRGAHNRENAAAAAATALARGVPAEAVVEALHMFAGVPHRLEEVAEHDGVLWVNDSKATNVASAAVGINAFDGGVQLILGGRLMGGVFVALREPVKARVRRAYLIGEATHRLAEDLRDTVPLVDAGNLDHAVALARKAAQSGEVVLLSPACASFDQYGSYEERGDHFRRLVG